MPREVTYKVNDDLCDKHPTWKQCRKTGKAMGKAKSPPVSSDMAGSESEEECR